MGESNEKTVVSIDEKLLHLLKREPDCNSETQNVGVKIKKKYWKYIEVGQFHR